MITGPEMSMLSMVKSSITFYLIQYQENAFHGELYLSVYYIL